MSNLFKVLITTFLVSAGFLFAMSTDFEDAHKTGMIKKIEISLVSFRIMPNRTYESNLQEKIVEYVVNVLTLAKLYVRK